MKNKIESLLAAIGHAKGADNPEMPAFQLNNPLLVRSFAQAGKHQVNEEGTRIFSSILAGTKACLYDLELKLRGQSRAGLKPTDTITNLAGVYGLKELGGVKAVVTYLRKAIGDESITKDTPLSYFLTEESK